MPRSTVVRRDSMVFLAGRRAMDRHFYPAGVNVSRSRPALCAFNALPLDKLLSVVSQVEPRSVQGAAPLSRSRGVRRRSLISDL
jgi:hypothetical protein